MGKTERRNVSQKKRSPVRTTLKLRKEKKMKGGELKKGEIDKIKNRDQDGIKESIFEVNALLDNLELMKTDLGKPEYINQVSKQTDKEKFEEDKKKFEDDKDKFETYKDNIINMIEDYFQKSLPPDFSNNYTATIEEVIPILKDILKFLEDVIKLPSSTNIDIYNQFKPLYDSLKQNVVDVIKIMEAIAEGAGIKIIAEDGTGVAAEEERSNMNKEDINTLANKEDINTLAAAAAAAATADKSGDKYATTGTGKSGADESDTNITDTNITVDDEFDAKLKEGLDMINNIFNSGMGMARNDENELFEKLKLAKRVINAYLIYIDKNERIKLKEYMDSGKLNTLFFKSEDINPLLKGELIITENDILNARNRLNKLNSDADNSLKNKVINNSNKYSIKNPEYVLTQDTFKQKINFLIDLLNEIDRKVKKKIEDTTKNASNEDTNKIKEINNITIDSDEELVTLNITDQEGHIIYSYILKFTRKGESVTSASASGSSSSSDKSVDTIGSESASNESVDTTGSESASSSASGSDSGNDKKVKENVQVTNVSASESERTLPPFTRFPFTRLSQHIRGGKRDSINDQYTIPKTVLTARMNEPFSIDDNSFIISN